MRINDLVRLQEYMRANGKEDYDVVKELLGGAKKANEEDEDKVTENVKKAIKDIVEISGGNQNTAWGAPPPVFGGNGNFDGIWTKMERTMSDEDIHQRYKELSIEYADKAMAIGNSDKSRSMKADELRKLDKWYSTEESRLLYQYVAPFSPDRKAAYAKSDGYIVELDEPMCFGNAWTMLRGPNSWSVCPTQTEMQRWQEFAKTRYETLKEYEAQHGQIPYVGQYSNRVITFIA